MEWKWASVRIDKAGEADSSKGNGKKILTDEVYLCAFCRGTGERPRGSKCPVCKGRKVVSVTPPAVVCAYCKGRGAERCTANVTCSVCRGKGVVPVQEPVGTCPACGGTGVPRGRSLYCVQCRGKGVITVKSPVREISRAPRYLQIAVAGGSNLTNKAARR